MTLEQLAKKTSERTGFVKKDVNTVLKEGFNIMHDTLLSGERVSIYKCFTIRPFLVKGYKINGKTVVKPHIRCSIEIKRREKGR